MQESIKRETERLTQAWMRHDIHILRDYLTQSVEDPRINAKSILTHHFLIDELFPNEHRAGPPPRDLWKPARRRPAPAGRAAQTLGVYDTAPSVGDEHECE